MIRLFISMAVFFTSQAIAAPTTTMPLPIGQMTEAGAGPVVCIAYKNIGQPPVFVVRSNRPTLFFEQLGMVKSCLKKVKQRIDNPEKFRKKIAPNYLMPPLALPAPPLVGEFQGIGCTILQNQEGLKISIEFSFPYLYDSEIDSLIRETPLQTCLWSAKPVPVDWRQQS